jgi:hypothetical protein
MLENSCKEDLGFLWIHSWNCTSARGVAHELGMSCLAKNKTKKNNRTASGLLAVPGEPLVGKPKL